MKQIQDDLLLYNNKAKVSLNDIVPIAGWWFKYYSSYKTPYIEKPKFDGNQSFSDNVFDLINNYNVSGRSHVNDHPRPYMVDDDFNQYKNNYVAQIDGPEACLGEKTTAKAELGDKEVLA